MSQRKTSAPVRQGPFDRYMMEFRREMAQSMAILLGEYDREFIVPIREWANQPWWKRIFSRPKDFEPLVEVSTTPTPEPVIEEPEPVVEVSAPQLVGPRRGAC